MNLRIGRETQKQMFLMVSFGRICASQSDTNMASLYKTLQIWAKRFSDYLAYEISYKPNSGRSWQSISQVLDFPH